MLQQRPWLVWFALTPLAWGSIALIVWFTPWMQFGPRPPWLLGLEFTVFPVIGWAALAAPVLAAVALFLRRWVQPALIALAVVAFAQLLVAAVEFATPPQPLPPFFEIYKG